MVDTQVLSGRSLQIHSAFDRHLAVPALVGIGCSAEFILSQILKFSQQGQWVWTGESGIGTGVTALLVKIREKEGFLGIPEMLIMNFFTWVADVE